MGRGHDTSDGDGLIEALFASETLGVAVVDPALRYVRVNATLARLNRGRAIEDHVGRSVEEVLTGTTIGEPVLEMLRASLRGETSAATILGDAYQVEVSSAPIRKGKEITGALVAVHDVSEKAAGVRELRQKLKIIQLVSRLSAQLLDEPAVRTPDPIDGALALIVEHFELDRAFLFTFSLDGTRLSMTHEHCAPGVEPDRENYQDLDVSGEVEPAVARILRGGRFVVDRASVLDDAEKTPLSRFFSKSFVILPLNFGGGVGGGAGFVYFRNHHEWQAYEIETLALAMELLASALARRKIDDELRDRLRFEELLASISTRLINAEFETIDEDVAAVLALVGTRGPFDRVIVFQQERERSDMRVTHEWCSAGTSSFRAATSGLSAQELGVPVERIMAGETVVFDVDDPSEHAVRAREAMQRAGADTIGTTPLFIKGEVWGALSFQIAKRRPLDPLLPRQIRLIGESIASVLCRQRADADLRRAFEELERLRAAAERERDYLREELREKPSFLIGDSPALKEALERVDAVADTRAAVLLHGESGVGKELFARAIHERSSRRNRPLVKVNCAAVPRELFESEFFGHVKGAFTGAQRDRVGRFELAHEGTILLDEVGEIPLEQQAKLLRVLQEGEIERVGDDRTRKVDVRVVAATNRDLEAMTREGAFRLDLYYRLSVFPIRIPPLRERGGDVTLLARAFLERQKRNAGRPFLELSPADERKLESYEWPGNVRELEHVIERAVLLSRTAPLRLDLALTVSEPAPRKPMVSGVVLREDELRTLERENILAALGKTNWRVSGDGGAAKLLGVRPSTLRDRMRVLGIQRPG